MPTADPLGLTFPADFAWGVATSAYQIEGATTEDDRGASIWDTFGAQPGWVRDGATGEVAADHYHRYPEDLDLIAGLGLRDYRFSIAWPRVVPDGAGPVNSKGLDFYQRLVDAMLERGIRPMATLYHWDLPQPLQDQGGWENRDVAYRFAEYATVVYDVLGDRVTSWLPINEPKSIVHNGYVLGVNAPGLRRPEAIYPATHHLALAHGLAVQALRATRSAARVGPALNLHPVYPADDSEPASRAAWLRDGYENRIYLDPIFRGHYPADIVADLGPDSALPRSIRDGDLDIISQPVDLLAVQYYCPLACDVDGAFVQRWPTSQAFWQQLYPAGLYDLLVRLATDYPGVDLAITENGLPAPDTLDADGTVHDPDRIDFLRDHLAEAHRAIAAGVPVSSFYVWSLLDNFEWQQGFAERWGLIYVDFPSQRRIPKSSAHWYRGVVARNAI